MSSSKQASSQAAWALLTEGVSSARVQAHRLRHMLNRALSLVESSEAKEHLQQVAGDILQGAPKRLDALERHLDRTALALSKMGETFLEARLPISDKTEVDEAVQPAFGGGKVRTSVDRLTQRWAVGSVRRLTPAIRREFARRAAVRGLDGNGRFPSIGRAINAVHQILEEAYDVGGVVVRLELDTIPSADLFRGEQGTRRLDVAFKTEDPFSPERIDDAVLVFSWHYFPHRDNYEVLVYLS